MAVAAAYCDHLLPAALLATPNLAEARDLTGRDDAPADLAARLADLGCAVVVTGGPEWRPGDGAGACTDWLCLPGGVAEQLVHPAVATTADHGTGCTFSSAVAALLAQGHALRPVCQQAAAYVTTQLTTSSTWDLGRGRGPIAHTSPSPAHDPVNGGT